MLAQLCSMLSSMSKDSALGKQEAVNKIHRLIGIQEQTLGPGSKERRLTLEKVAEFVGMDASSARSKQQLAASLSEWIGCEWDSNCYSTGDTITLEGMNRILKALEKWKENSPERVPIKSEASLAGVDAQAENDEIEEENDERQALEWSISELISNLSEADETPREVDSPGYSFDPTEIDFSTTSWMACLSAVQGWLRLPSSLQMTEPRQFIEQLATLLGMEDLGDAFSISTGTELPSDELLELLRDRLEQAVQNLEVYIEAREIDGSSRAAATAIWIEAWEDEGNDPEDSGPVSARTGTWPIFQFSEDARRGRLNLSPSYQRGDVWPTKVSQVLIESILRGIPLPSIIVLKPNNQDGVTSSAYEVVDGKQRLTAILRFTGRHPDALEFVRRVDAEHDGENLLHLFETDYPRFRRKWKNLLGEPLTAGKEREYCFPFKLRKGKTSLSGILKPLEGKYYTQILEARVQISDESCTVSDVFRSSTYQIPVIEYLRANHRQIHEVFELYNRQGKHLNAEEIRNAVFHELVLTRALIVASGDNEDVKTVAPCLVSVWDDLKELGGLLEQYGSGVTRYKRTKLLSWLVSALVYDSIRSDSGRPQILSTARQIDALFKRIEDSADDPLRREDRIRELLCIVAKGVEAHSSVDEAWAPRFKDTANGLKWQELQLIGSLLGVVGGAVVLENGIQTRLEATAELMREASDTDAWQRPEKTQTKSQWEFIAKIALNVLDVLGVDPAEVSEKLKTNFGHSGIPALVLINGS